MAQGGMRGMTSTWIYGENNNIPVNIKHAQRILPMRAAVGCLPCNLGHTRRCCAVRCMEVVAACYAMHRRSASPHQSALPRPCSALSAADAPWTGEPPPR